MKPTYCYHYLLFHLYNPNKNGNTSSRAKTILTQSHTFVKYRGIVICIKINSIINTGDLKILYKKCPNNMEFPDIIFNFFKIVCVLPSTSCMTGEL